MCTLEIRGADGPTRFHLSAVDGRLVLGLLVSGRDKPIDVSRQPAVLTSVVRDSDIEKVAQHIDDFCAAHGLWRAPAEQPDLARALTGAAFPLLGAAYDQGFGTVRVVHRWARPAVDHQSVKGGARAAFGTKATRVVVSALGRALLSDLPPATVPLAPLALAVMAAPTVSSDALGRVIDAAAATTQPSPSAWPDDDDVARMQRVGPELGAARVERMVFDACAHPDGVRLLANTVRLFDQLHPTAKRRLPTGLVALHDRCLELMPVDPQPPPPDPVIVESPVLAPPVDNVPTRGRRTQALPYPPRIRWLDGHLLDPGLRLVLPRTPVDLVHWGQLLHNCLGSFGTAAATSRSVIVGIEHDGELSYCVEIEPASRTIRQFLGRFNTQVPPRIADPVCEALYAAGVMDETRVW